MAKNETWQPYPGQIVSTSACRNVYRFFHDERGYGNIETTTVVNTFNDHDDAEQRINDYIDRMPVSSDGYKPELFAIDYIDADGNVTHIYSHSDINY